MRLRPLHEQVVVVMGASSGIGRETALALAGRGARLIVSARGEEGLDTLVDAILGMGGEAYAVPADVRDARQVLQVAETAVRRHGRLDTWVHLSSVSLYARFEDTDPREFEQVVDINLLGAMRGAMAAIPHLRDSGGGSFICVSSVEAVRALPYQSAYAAAKHGLDGMLEALRVELLRERAPVVISQILPSSIDTPLFDHARTRLGVRPKGFPPVYHPKLVTDAILHAAAHPTRRLVVGGGGKLLATLEGIAPRLVDGYLALSGKRAQSTGIPKSEAAPDNLDSPIDYDHSVEAGPEQRGRRWSLYTAWTLSRWSRPVTLALLAGGGALLARSLSQRARADRRPEGRPRPEAVRDHLETARLVAVGVETDWKD